MTTPARPNSLVKRSARAGSWMALLAATTLGDAAPAAASVHAAVTCRRADGLKPHGTYRLVVQSYDARNGRVPDARARPIGSMQRAVTADELRRGVHVNLLELRGSGADAATTDDPMVVAWVEAGEPDLEFDARAARPTPGSVYGEAKGGRNVQISLRRTI